MVFADPFEALFNFQRTLDALRESSWLESTPSGGGPYPPLNVFHKGDDFVIITEIPGVKASDLDIKVRGNAIRIAGIKTVDYSDKASRHRHERMAGSFDRTVTIPVEIDPERVKAELRDGILALYLARAERDKPKSIKVV
jgi:HSP20 family protein